MKYVAEQRLGAGQPLGEVRRARRTARRSRGSARGAWPTGRAAARAPPRASARRPAGRRGAPGPRAPASRGRRPSWAARGAGRSRGSGTAAGTAGSRWRATGTARAATGDARRGRLDRDLDGLLDRVVGERGRREVGGVLVEVLHCHVSSVGGGAHTTDQRPTYSGPVSASRPPARRSSGWVIGRAVGAPIILAPSWLIAAVVLTLIFAPTVRARADLGALVYVVALGFVVLLFASVLVHELAHGLMARARGQQPREFVLTLWGGHTAFGGATPTPASSALIAVVGPIANLAARRPGSSRSRRASRRTASSGCCVWSGCLTNAFVGLFNLVPGLPLDGGLPARGGRLGGHQEPAHGDRRRRVGRPRRRRRRVRLGARCCRSCRAGSRRSTTSSGPRSSARSSGRAPRRRSAAAAPRRPSA